MKVTGQGVEVQCVVSVSGHRPQATGHSGGLKMFITQYTYISRYLYTLNIMICYTKTVL
jgi:hypothetical protein